MEDTDAESRTELRSLGEQLDGSLLRPGDAAFDAARSVWNGMIDRRPAAIARCVNRHDVVCAVSHAREGSYRLSVKGGGHHVSGSAVCDEGLMLDLSPMNEVRVDPESRTARVEAGATWGAIDEACQAHGLAVPGSQDPSVGVAGLTLGGGVGWLSPKFGLTCDNLLAADVVTAEGDLIRASATSNPELFWAIRGGGGNFGIVTTFEFRLHEVGPEILAGTLIYPPENTRPLVRRYESFVSDAPREARPLLGSMELPAVPYYPEEVHNERVWLLILFYGGDPREGETVLEPLREFGEPLMDSVRPRNYVAWQQVGEAAAVKRSYVRSQYLETFSEEAIETVRSRVMEAPESESESTVFISPRWGAETEPAVDATAYPHRTDSHHLLIETRWTDPDRDEENVEWVREFHEDLEPHTTGEKALNFLTDDEIPGRVTAALGTNYERLLEVKREWDPQNVFRMNPNIDPDRC